MPSKSDSMTCLAEAFGLSVFLEAEGREMDTRTEDLGLGQNTDTTNAIDLHLHIWITVGVAEVGQMRPPGSVLCISFDNDGIFVERVGKR